MTWIREYKGIYTSRCGGYKIWKDASEPDMWDLRRNNIYIGSYFTLREAKQASGLR